MDIPRRFRVLPERQEGYLSEQDIPSSKTGYECDVDYAHEMKHKLAKRYDPEMKNPTWPRADKKDTLETEDNVYIVKQEKEISPYCRHIKVLLLDHLCTHVDLEPAKTLFWLQQRLMGTFSVYFLTKQKNYEHMLLPDVPHYELCKHSFYERPENLPKQLDDLHYNPGVIVLFDKEAADAFNKVLDRYVYEIELLAILVVTGRNDPNRIKRDFYHLPRHAKKWNIYTKVTTQDTLAEDIDLAWENVFLKSLKTRVKWMKQTMCHGWKCIEESVTQISRQIGDVELLPEQVEEQNADDRLVVVKQETNLPSCYQYYIKPLIEEVKSISQSEDMQKTLPRLKRDTEGLAKEKLKVLFLTKQKLYKQMLLPAISFVQTEKHALAHALCDDECKDHLVVILRAEEQDIFWQDFKRIVKRHVTLLIIKDNEQSDYQEIPPTPYREYIYVKLTTQGTLAEDIDQAVERHVLNGLKDCLEMLRTCGVLPALKGQIHRLEERVCGISSLIGDDQAPNKSALEHDWALPQEKVDEMISRVNNIDNVIGCGFNKTTLEIYIDESADTEGTEKEISELLRDYEVRYAVWKTKKNFRQFRSPGEEIFQRHLRGTLTGFVISQRLVMALLSKHVAGEPGNTLYTMAENIYTVFGRVLHSHESLDLSLANVTVDNFCTQFKNEDGSPLAVPCTVKENVDYLQNLPVYIYGANSRPGVGIIVTPEQKIRDNSGRDIHYVLIENLSEHADDFCHPGDSGAIVLAKVRCPKRKAWAIAVVVGKILELSEEHAGKYIALFLHAGLQHMSESFGQPLQLVTE